MLGLLLGVSAQTTPTATFTPALGVLDAHAFEHFLSSNANVSRLVLAPGAYHITKTLSGAHLPLTQHMSNVLIDMTDVTLIMDERSQTAVRVSNWQNVTLQGLTIKYDEYPTNQAIVVAFSEDGKSVDVEVPEGYPTDDWEARKTFSCNVYQRATQFLKVGCSDMYAEKNGPVADYPRRYRLTYGHNVGPTAQPIAVGDTLGCRNAAFAFTFHVDGCSASTFRDITLYGGPGFGFFHGHPSSNNGTNDAINAGGNTFQRLTLTYPDQPSGASMEPVLSASADAFHANGVPNGITIESSLLEGHNDDGIALHGTYSLVVDAPKTYVRSSSAEAFQLVVMSGDFGVGDHLKVYDKNFLLVSMFTVTTVGPAQPAGKYCPPQNRSHTMPGKRLLPEPQTQYQQLGLEVVEGWQRPPGLGFDFVIFNTNRSCSRFRLVNNTIRNHRARGMLIKASHGVIMGNHIENSSLGGIVITPGSNNSNECKLQSVICLRIRLEELGWGEGDYSTDLTVIGNVVRNVCIGQQCYGGLALGAKNPNNAFPGGAPYYGHANVKIVNNTFANISQMNMWVSSTQNLEVSGNNIVSPYSYPPVATCCPPFPFPEGLLVWITETTNATIMDNCVWKPAASMGPVYLNTTSTVADSKIVSGGFRLCH